MIRQGQMRQVPRPTGTLDALQRIVGKRGGTSAPKRNVPKGNAYGYHRKRGTVGADLGPLGSVPDPSDKSRRQNFQRELDMNRGRSLQAPRRSAPRPPY